MAKRTRVAAARMTRKTQVEAYCAGPLGFHQSQKRGVANEWKKVMDIADMPISISPSPAAVLLGIVMLMPVGIAMAMPVLLEAATAVVGMMWFIDSMTEPL